MAKARKKSTTPRARAPQAHSISTALIGEGSLRADTLDGRWQTRWVKWDRKRGRPPVNSALVQELQDELEVHWQARKTKPKQEPEGVEFVKDRLKAKGRRMGDKTILRQVVAPVHRKLWPKRAG
jgi:hypothetical protein